MRRIRRKSPLDYLLPFLILVGIGVVVILAFQLWSNFQKQSKADVYFYIVEGRAQVLPYGQQSWDRAFSGTKFLQGDSLKTSAAGKAVLEFFNGTLIRLGDDTTMTLKDLVKEPERENITAYLESGTLWVNGHKSEGVKEAFYQVETPHLMVKAKGTTFAVENKNAEIVRVLDGTVTVDIKVIVDGKERIVNAAPLSVGVGQEIVLDSASLKAFENNENPSILQGLSDEFKQSEWYSWNVNEDRSPSEFGSLQDGASETQLADTQETSQTSATTQETSQLTQENTQETQTVASDMLGITQPSSANTTIQTDRYTISGTAVSGVAKIVVEQEVGSNTSSYTLQKFKAGDSTWVYNISAATGNLQPGKNVYRFIAQDASGKKSEPAEITITYEKSSVTISEPLTAPAVKTFNGSSSSTVETGTVQVTGTIQGAEKVVVNGYTLSRFKPGDTTWSYFANESAGNLKPGVNTYQVYGIDEEGNKSSVVEFTITYNKNETTPPPAPPTPTPNPTPTTQQTQFQGL